MPEDRNVDRSYFMKLAELEGKLNLLQEILDDHKHALAEFAEKKQTVVEGGEIPRGETIQTIAHEAGARVHTN